jgi:hypothetical protein
VSLPLCKFGSADGAAKVLEFGSVFITSPLDLNDPFEMRPAWTNTHELEQFEERQMRNQLTGGMFGAEPPVPVDNQIGLSDHYNERVFRDLHERFRVLSLLPSIIDIEKNHAVSKPEDTLMWSHYGDHNQGICLVFDAEQFNNGLRKGGFPVEYDPHRKGMPTDLYSAWKRLFEPGSESLDRARHELLYRNYIEILTRKSPEWKYEREIRMIYEKSALDPISDFGEVTFPCPICARAGRSKDACNCPVFRDTVKIPPSAVRAVVFGADIPTPFVEPVLRILSEDRYAHVTLYWASLHSSDYRMHYLHADADSIRTYQEAHTERIGRAKDHFTYSSDRCSMPPYGAQKGINFHRKA